MGAVPAGEGIIDGERQLSERVVAVCCEQAPGPRPASLPSAFDELDPYREPSSRTSRTPHAHGSLPRNRGLSGHVHARPDQLSLSQRFNTHHRSISSPRVCSVDVVRSPGFLGWSRRCVLPGVFSSVAVSSCSTASLTSGKSFLMGRAPRSERNRLL